MCLKNIFKTTLNYCIIYRAYDWDAPSGQYCRIFARKKIKSGLKMGDRILIDDKTALSSVQKIKRTVAYLEPVTLDWQKKEYVIKLLIFLMDNGWEIKTTGYSGLRLVKEATERRGYNVRES